MRWAAVFFSVLLVFALAKEGLNAQANGQAPPSVSMPTRELAVVVVGQSLDISDAQVVQWLDAASAIFQSRDGGCRNKMPCRFALKLKGTIALFKDSGYIEDTADLVRIHGITKADLMIVKKIASSACQGELGSTILGCTGADWIAVARPPGNINPAVVWAHEYGHFSGLGHRPGQCELMNRFYDPRNLFLSPEDCATIQSTAPR